MNEPIITGGTLAVTLTCDQLQCMIRDAVMEVLSAVPVGRGKTMEAETQTERYNSKDYAYGLDGICRMFGVSKSTAVRYKATWLAPAVKQRGQNIIVDRKMAFELFEQRNNNQ